MQVIEAVQPYVAVDTGSFIKPTFVLSSINSYSQYTFLVVVEIIGDIIRRSYIPTLVIAKIKTVQPEARIPKYTVKLKLESLPGIFLRDSEMFAVPANTGFWKKTTHRFIPVSHHIKIL